jgi:hypothetical protein
MGDLGFFVTGEKDYSNILPMRREKNDEGSDEKVESVKPRRFVLRGHAPLRS